jgi:oligoendopeptidase F
MIAQIEQKFDESYEKEYRDQKNRIVSLEGNHAADDKNLKQKEDLEASNLRNKILSDENSNLQQNLDSSLLTVQMTKDMTKKTFEETEQRINSIREQYEEEIIRIQAELLAAKKKELEALEAKSAESATTTAGGVAVETPEVATAEVERNEINEKIVP